MNSCKIESFERKRRKEKMNEIMKSKKEIIERKKNERRYRQQLERKEEWM